MSAECPCGGQHWADWHRARGLPMCQAARELKAASDLYADRRRRARGPRGPSGRLPAVWVPGTEIEVPEVDPL